MKRRTGLQGGVLIVALLMWLGLGAGSCEMQRRALGDDHIIAVVADSTMFTLLKPALSKAIEKELRTPWPEKIFEIKYVLPGELKSAVMRQNVVMLGTLDGKDQTSQQVQSMLSESMKQRVQAGEAYLFRKDSPWAKGQLLLVLAAPTAGELFDRIDENADYIFSILREHSLERTKKIMFSRYEQKKIEDMLLQKYGWTLRVQHDYVVFQEIPEAGFVHLRRTSPERWLFVHWEETDDPTVVTDREWMIKKRNEIGRLFYEDDVVVDTLYTFYEDEIAGRWVLVFQGLWENNKRIAGGPLKIFAFYDENTRRAYMIDIAVFAPGKRKEPFMRQLEIMARTFRTAEDLKKAPLSEAE